jgi:dolichol-phosphate mannosyltransferase
VPALREAGNLRFLLERISTSLEPLAVDYEVLVVDDDSRDGTEAVVGECEQANPRIRLLVRAGERGLAGAVVHGWRHTDAGVLGVMDADLQHPPELLPELWKALEAGNDLAIASRYVRPGELRDWNPVRRLLSRLGAWMIASWLRPAIPVKDPLSGFFLVRRACVAGLALQPQGFKILLEILVRGAVRSATEIPFQFGVRQTGRSKASLKVGLDYLSLLWRLRWAGKQGAEEAAAPGRPDGS